MKSHKTGLFRTSIWVRLALAMCLMAGGCGQPPYNFLLRGSDGEPIRSEPVIKILNDPDLTEEEQKDALRELGITDDQMIDLLLRGF